MFLRALAREYDDMRAQNENAPSPPIRALYRWIIVIGSLQLALWAALVLVKS